MCVQIYCIVIYAFIDVSNGFPVGLLGCSRSDITEQLLKAAYKTIQTNTNIENRFSIFVPRYFKVGCCRYLSEYTEHLFQSRLLHMCQLPVAKSVSTRAVNPGIVRSNHYIGVNILFDV